MSLKWHSEPKYQYFKNCSLAKFPTPDQQQGLILELFQKMLYQVIKRKGFEPKDLLSSRFSRQAELMEHIAKF